MRSILTVVTLIIAGFCGWLFIDVPLDAETKQWLEPPERFDYDQDLLGRLAARAEELPQQWDELKLKCLSDQIDQTCIDWVVNNPRAASEAIPDDTFFALYDAALAEKRIDTHATVDSTNLGGALIVATKMVVMRDVVSHGRVLPQTIARLLPQHRRYLAQADGLVDWMVFAGTIAIIEAAAANAVQSMRHDEPDLLEILAPLTAAELDAHNVFRGVFRFTAAGTEFTGTGFSGWGAKPNFFLNMQRKHIQKMVEASRLSRGRFWQTKFVPYEVTFGDRAVGGLLSWFPFGVGDYAYYSYVTSIRSLDVRLALVRGLAVQDLPPAPTAWRWQRSESSLCLIPDSNNVVARNRGSAFELCASVTGLSSTAVIP